MIAVVSGAVVFGAEGDRGGVGRFLADPVRTRYVKRSNKLDYATQCGRLKALAEKWKSLLIENYFLGQ